MDDCKVAESGKHEPDYERLNYETHVGADSARFGTICIHCKVGCEIEIYDADFIWSDDQE